jgi:16S rRNA (cytidine1402-2'-O)-methyltransferase
MGTLSVVATPIGNLGDITLRALTTLKHADAIACEDTRVTAKLLAHYEIKKPLLIYHEASAKPLDAKILALLAEGKHVALVTDAGTPGISDPGTLLVARAREAGATIEAIPGASALAAALSISGVDTSEFLFLGFLPHKKGRQTLFKQIAAEERAVVFYESPHRIEKALLTLAELAPERVVAVCRELTKLHEEVVRGTAAEVLAQLTAAGGLRGEFVVIVSRF